jgi:hypothetical protein
MSKSHLTAGQIVAVRDGEFRDQRIIEHLQSCLECQVGLRNARMLRVLLTQPASDRTLLHPEPEELTEYASETAPGRDYRRLEAHVAGCPPCFADLKAAIWAPTRSRLEMEEAPPDRFVAAAVERFQPPRTSLKIGGLAVWLCEAGLSLRFTPRDSALAPLADLAGPFATAQARPPSPRKEMMSRAHRGAGASQRERRTTEKRRLEVDARLGKLMRLSERLQAQVGEFGELLKDSPEVLPAQERLQYELKTVHELFVQLHAAVERSREKREDTSTPSEPQPVTVAVADLLATIRVSGRIADQVRLAVAVARSQDNAPLPGALLALAAEGRPPMSATTNASGLVEFPLPQGRATLSFQSPVRADLTITF